MFYRPFTDIIENKIMSLQFLHCNNWEENIKNNPSFFSHTQINRAECLGQLSGGMGWNRNQDNTLEYLNIYECYISHRGLKRILNATGKNWSKTTKSQLEKKLVTTLETVKIRTIGIWCCHMLFNHCLSWFTSRVQRVGTGKGISIRCCVWHSQGKGALPVGKSAQMALTWWSRHLGCGQWE